MKKLLVGLLALVSISSFAAQDCSILFEKSEDAVYSVHPDILTFFTNKGYKVSFGESESNTDARYRAVYSIKRNWDKKVNSMKIYDSAVSIDAPVIYEVEKAQNIGSFLGQRNCGICSREGSERIEKRAVKKLISQLEDSVKECVRN